MTKPPDSSPLSPEDVAARLNVPKQIVLDLIKRGTLHAVRYSRKTIRIPVWSVEDHEKKECLTRIPMIRPNPGQSV